VPLKINGMRVGHRGEGQIHFFGPTPECYFVEFQSCNCRTPEADCFQFFHSKIFRALSKKAATLSVIDRLVLARAA
jgi:hypothetical protein